MLNSENSASETANTLSLSTSENSDSIQNSPNLTKIIPNYTDVIQEIFKTVNNIKEILQINQTLTMNVKYSHLN